MGMPSVKTSREAGVVIEKLDRSTSTLQSCGSCKEDQACRSAYNFGMNLKQAGPMDQRKTVAEDEESSTARTANNGSVRQSEAEFYEPTQVSESYSSIFSTLSSSLKWCPTSEQELARAESALLACLKRPFKSYFIDIGPGWGNESNKIRTLEMLTPAEAAAAAAETASEIKKSVDEQAEAAPKPVAGKGEKIPVILVHGFAAGIGTWILNLDSLSASVDNRKFYAIDLIGFARSTRAPFDLSADVEGQFVDSIERWRARMGIERVLLLGHSFGGYLCASYALRHPQRVAHVILADPWGIQDRQISNRRTYRLPIWVRVVNSIFQGFNPLAALRAVGPYGPSVLQKLRADLREKFRPALGDDCHKFLDYIYHANTQRATGETAFKSLTLPYGWPKNPLIHRLLDLNESVSLTFIYGSRSWIEKAPGEFLRDCMAPGRVSVHIILNSGHHVYADKYDQFNELVREACAQLAE